MQTLSCIDNFSGIHDCVRDDLLESFWSLEYTDHEMQSRLAKHRYDRSPLRRIELGIPVRQLPTMEIT